MTRPTSTYDELDAAIVAAIRGGCRRFSQIWPRVEALAQTHTLRNMPDRVVDRRLQALSRQRKIRFWRGNWEVL